MPEETSEPSSRVAGSKSFPPRGPGDRSKPPVCPDCGGDLSEPIAGDVHCFRRCLDCGAEFELSDPRL